MLASEKLKTAVKIFVLIVNYRTAELVVDCLASIEPQRALLAGGAVLVMDNASGDGSPQMLRRSVSERQWQGWVEVLEMPRNGGFSYGNNAGIRRAQELANGAPHHVLLLNPDAMVKPGCLAQVLDFLATHPRAGIVGVPIENGHGQQETSAHRWPTAASELMDQARLSILSRVLARWDISFPPSTGALKCDWISGAFFLIRHEVLRDVGLMDEGFFLYFEEVDYCRRASLKGWEVWQAPSSGIVHLEGASTGIREARRPRASYWFDSRRRYLQRAHGWSGLLWADLMSLLGRGLYLVRKLLRLGSAAREDQTPQRYHAMLLGSDIKAAWNAFKLSRS
jgi:N-acetylglucosaminyl-diphospho-decaprenol L-rhamnosyltransferase